MRARFVGFVTVMLVAASLTTGGDDPKKFVSGPQPGETLPGAFDTRVISGDFKGKQHCLVCENRQFPVVMVFVREPELPREIKDDGPIMQLLAKLEEAVPLHESSYLKSFVVFLSARALNSATNEGKKEPKELVEEAKNRERLIKKLEARSERFKNVIFATMPAEGPKAYKLSPDAEATVIFFNNLKVLKNDAFKEGAMTSEDAARIVADVEKTIKSWKVRPK